MNNYLDLLKLNLPEFLINHFNLVKNTKNGEVMHLYFEEQNISAIEDHNRIQDITKSLKRTNTIVPMSPTVLIQEEQNEKKKLTSIRDSEIIKTHKGKKTPLITENEAEEALLKTFFNIES